MDDAPEAGRADGAHPYEIDPSPRNLRGLSEATERLWDTCAGFSDADVAAPSGLPGWTRGHVLSHLARQAPALERLLDWAATGVENPQYASRETRNAEIEEGAHRSAADLVSEARHTADRLQRAVAGLPAAAWDTPIRPITGETCTARRVLVIRLREIEVHHLDLAAGYAFADIPAEAAGVILNDVSAYLDGLGTAPPVELRDPDGAVTARFGGPARERRTVTGTTAAALGWLTGRTRGQGLAAAGGLPELPGWI